MAGKRNNDKPKKKGKKKNRRYYLGGAVAFVLLLVWWGTLPMRGTMHVGICRTFAELNVLYPKTMRLTWAERFDRSQRLYFLHIDGFGQDKTGFIECRFKHPFNSGNFELERVYINRRPVPAEEVERFNLSIPALLASELDLIIPPPPKGDLRSLRLPEE